MQEQTSSNSLGERVPKLRFPDKKGNFFTDYTHNTVRGLFTRITQRNTKGITNVITNSAEHGLLPQRDFFDKDIAVDSNTSNYYVIKSGDFVYNPRKSNQAPYGPFNCYNYMDEGIVSPLYTCLRPKVKEYTEFLLWYFKSPVWHSYVYHNGAQGGARHDRVGMTTELMNGIPINLPDISEQQKIVSFLNLIERKVAIQSKLVALFKLYKRGLLSKLFPQKDESVPQYRFVGFTDAWEQRKVSDVAEIIAGGTPSTKVESYWEPKEIPWLSSGEVHKKYITFTDDMISKEGMNNSSAKMVKENSVLIALAGQGKTRGTVAINRISLTTNQSIAAMTFDEEIVPEFVFCNLENRYDEIRRMSSGDGSRGGLNKQLVGDIEIPYITKIEQEKIGAYFMHLNHLITLHQQMCNEMQSIKKFILQNMFV